MQFKYPAVFYFLVILIIPFVIHLFRLQRFKKIPFTNVQLLKTINSETRKSSRIKKLLVLLTRIICFTAILFTFSQPYFSNKKITLKNHTFIYLDNSMSLNTNGNKLKLVAQKIIENGSDTDTYSLLTNDELISNISKKDLDNYLKKIKLSTKKSYIEEKIEIIERETNKSTKGLYKVILISDFQYINKYIKTKFTNVNIPFYLANIQNTSKNNISIDSVFISSKSPTENLISVVIKNQGETKNNIPIALYNASKLINKRSFSISKNEIKIIEFEINKMNNFKGKFKITFNDTFLFDNTFFFTMNTTKKTSILNIGIPSQPFSKIFIEDEFVYRNSTPQKINYDIIPEQELIILNQLKKIPKVLGNSLLLFVENGGNLLIIPDKTIEIQSYNSLFNKITTGTISGYMKDSLKITDINFQHPLYNGVFSKKVTNFQYPSVAFSFQHNLRGEKIISFENKTPFLQEIKNKYSKIYLFSSPLDKQSTNFTNSPLIVPTLYNIGLKSLEIAKPYYTLDQENRIEINKKIDKEQIVTISNSKESFIPFQKSFPNKIIVTTKESPKDPGFYNISLQKDTIKTIAYNIFSKESLLSFYDLNTLKKENKYIQVYTSIKELFNEINKKNKVQWLWKLFLTIAIVSLLLEILILKFFKT